MLRELLLLELFKGMITIFELSGSPVFHPSSRMRYFAKSEIFKQCLIGYIFAVDLQGGVFTVYL
jgi:hypothetical protein